MNYANCNLKSKNISSESGKQLYRTSLKCHEQTFRS